MIWFGGLGTSGKKILAGRMMGDLVGLGCVEGQGGGKDREKRDQWC